MVYCHCMSMHVCLGEILFSLAVWPFSWEKKLSFWLSACSVLIMVPLRKTFVRPSFPLVS